MAKARNALIGPEPFQLVKPDGTIVADGYYVFGQYIVAWRNEPPVYRTYPSIEAAIEAHGSEGDNLTVRWT